MAKELKFRNFIDRPEGPVAMEDMDQEALAKWREATRARIERELNLYYGKHPEEYRKLIGSLN